MGPLVVAVVLGALLLAAVLYCCCCARAAEQRAQAAEQHARAGREDVVRALGSLERTHGSLEVIAMMMEEQRRQLERVEWIKASRPLNDNGRARATSSRSDGGALPAPSPSRPSWPHE